MSAVADRVARVIAEQSGHAVSSVKPESMFIDDLGMDSLDIIEAIMAIEEEFDVVIDDEQAERVRSVADAVALVEKLTAPAGA